MKITDLQCEHMPAGRPGDCDVYCIGTDRPHFSFRIDGADRNASVRSYKLIVSSSAELSADGVGDMYDTGTVQGSNVFDIEYCGKPLLPLSIYYFKVYVMVGKTALKSNIGVFATGIGDAGHIKDHFITAPEGHLRAYDVSKGRGGRPAPYFRRDVRLEGRVSSIYAYVTSLGVFEFFINGKRIGDAHFDPGFTDYHKTLQYRFFDVTKYFTSGTNTIGAVVGSGWYNSYLGYAGEKDIYGDKNALSIYFRVIYKDGSWDEFYTDDSWECASGAYIYTDNQNGEYYDARLERRGRFEPGHDDYGWAAAVKYVPPFISGTKLLPVAGPSVKVNETIDPVSISRVGDDYIVDMGQNMVGVLSVKLKCEAGTVITFRHGEMLNDADKGERGCDGSKGTLYTENLRGAEQTDTYICRGQDDEYIPHFTFHGFRYVQIHGLPYEPAIEDVKGLVMYSACRRTGSVRVENKDLRQLISNIEWGHRGNFLSLPTDCPQRNERLGWTGDAQVFSKSACYGMDCAEFYNKYMRDVTDAQKPNGSVTSIAPMVRKHNGADLTGNGAAAWGDAIFIIPFNVYRIHGDKRVLSDTYPYAEKYFEYLFGTTDGLLRPAAGYGDWLSVYEETPKDVLATAFFAYDAYIMSYISEILGKRDRSEYYKTMFDRISEEWREAYIRDGNIIKGDTQCDYLLALKFGLVKGDEKDAAVAHLLRKIKEADGHLRTGFVGVGYLLPVLCDNGHADTAYEILCQTTYPSWLYSVKNGATTIWERWNSYTEENGFGDAGMNSFNHYSLGSCYEWMYEYMLGIKPVTPGFARFLYRPYPDKRITGASGSYNSPSGTIGSEWRYNGHNYDMKLTVPVNATAVVLPDEKLHIGGIRGYQPVSEMLELGSGVHTFKLFE